MGVSATGPRTGHVEHHLAGCHGHPGLHPGQESVEAGPQLPAQPLGLRDGGRGTAAAARAASLPSANRVTSGVGSGNGSVLIACHTSGGMSIESPARTAAAASGS